MTPSTARIIRLGLALVLVIIAGNAALSFWNARRTTDDERRVVQTNEILKVIAETFSMLKDAETGQRGYLLTGDPAYLAPYHAALASIPDSIRRLEALTADDRVQRSRIEAARGHIDRKLDELAKTVQLRRDEGFEAALAVVRGDSGKRAMDAIRALFAQMKRREAGLLKVRAASSERAYTMTLLTCLVAALTSVGLIGLVYSIVGRIIAERVRAEAFQEADRRKDEFLAILAHELRNPLAAIRAALDSIRLGQPDDPSIRRAGDTIDHQVEHLALLVEDLLDASRIAQGKLVLRQGPLELAEAVDLALEISRPLIDARDQQLSVALPAGPLPLEGDRTRLAQVFANLLTNAAKYSERGSRIALEALRDRDQVVVRVRDEGQGIDPEMLPHIFGLYAQEDRTRERSQGGLGIGLALVRRLVEMHGGAVEAHSAGPGQGSEFVVRLPLAPVGATRGEVERPPEPTNGFPSRPRRILVADDSEDFADLYAMMLTSRGYEVRVAHDGATAVEAAREFRPEAVLMDIGLPKLNGFEVAERLRSQPETREMFLVALSGRVDEEDRLRSLSTAFDHFLTKPVRFATVEEVLATPRRTLELS